MSADKVTQILIALIRTLFDFNEVSIEKNKANEQNKHNMISCCIGLSINGRIQGRNATRFND
jgi:hypothetical protein